MTHFGASLELLKVGQVVDSGSMEWTPCAMEVRWLLAVNNVNRIYFNYVEKRALNI